MTHTIQIELSSTSISSLAETFAILKQKEIDYKIINEQQEISETEKEKLMFNNKLNEKAIEIIEFLNEGYTYSEIAKRAEISIDGVRYYIKKIFKVLGVNNARSALKIYNEMNK